MRKTPYVNTVEGSDFMVATAVHDGLIHLIKNTKEVPEWVAKFQAAFDNVKTVLDERLDCMDTKERKKAIKRLHSVAIVSGDYNFSRTKSVNYTVGEDDLLDCLNVVCENHCYGCTRTKWRSCEWRQRFDRMGIFAKVDGPETVCQYMVKKYEVKKEAEE